MWYFGADIRELNKMESLLGIRIVGGRSSLAHVLRHIFSKCAALIAAGRIGCEVHLDLNNSLFCLIEYYPRIPILLGMKTEVANRKVSR